MNRIIRRLFFASLTLLYLPVSAQNQDVSVKPDAKGRKVDISIGGAPFTTYLFPDTLEKPILYPIHAANGAVITRGFPIDPQPGEPTDHPHQVGMWFTYENVNDLDFWNNSYAIPADKKSDYGWIRQQKILRTESGKIGILKVATNWENQKKKTLLKEVTTFRFSGNKHQRIIDRTTQLTAVVPVTFKDVKDGLLGLRVAKGLQMPNGNYLTSEGKTGDSAWGTRARWCMLYGELEGQMTSITIFDNPDNPGYPTYWHARGYGLFAANPLGEKVFSNGKQTMNLHLKPGQAVTFRYRVIINTGKIPSTDELNKEADDFAGKPLTLWYNKPADGWTEALPIGNGRLAAMVFGGVSEDRLQLNEGTIWAGEPGNNVPHEEVFDSIQKIRRLLFEGKNLEAQRLSNRTFPREAPPDNNYGMPYQTAGSLYIQFPNQKKVSNYKRDLDIRNAVAHVSYQSNGVNYKREYIASIPDQVIMVRLTADQPGSISFDLNLNTPFQKYQVETKQGRLILSGVTGSRDNKKGKVHYQVQVYPKIEGGAIRATDSSLKIRKANKATVYLSIATNFINYKDLSGNASEKASGFLEKALNKDYILAKEDQITCYRKYFDRVSLDLGTTEAAKKPTDIRIAHFKKEKDPALPALFFQFGRYLLITSSYPGSQPANLQGKWNAQLNPPWDSKYTVNINTEMNYWPAEVTGLSEMHQPLFDMLKDLSVTGRESASKMYHARGWNMHHNTDLWRITGLVDGGYYGIWPMGGAWLTQQIWQHYLFTGDTAFLRDYYPVLKGAAAFYVDVLQVEPEHHWLVVSPSMSPEHSYMHKDGVSVDITYGTTMDNQLVFDVFSHTIAAAKILERDQSFSDTLQQKRDSLPPMQIGQYGQLQEWIKDWDNPNDHHRHVSHLYGLFPGNQISPFRNPKLFEAARTSLIQRGDVSTGWSMAWKINLWARLLDGNHALKLLKDQLRLPEEGQSGGGTYPNLFDAHPPFQIDGNFGGTAGIANMLLQSDGGSLFILPALPDEWGSGEVKGLRTVGGFIVDIAWKERKLTRLTIHSTIGGNCRIRTYDPVQMEGKFSLDTTLLPNPFFKIPDVKAPLVSPRANLKGLQLDKTYVYSFETNPGETYHIKLKKK